ncbi:Tim17/Tim22/Tim23/Pmp24 family-domain-containing protein [Lipomyces tetrasporus]|uniref:Tim17/Tim22/Tim23/Pmp24 family-domain-containing protein n=1 Tax=Lipomyces tetrasporus TaxID=54092 RepID=A0AAD7QLI7_9ASCO|nr:Tim17/Tim22/Tim23/Pmp24 family-domain-containing protein [Lipomyces tetrasporus]KAJ8097516.1 Tim17/Tim22/Tim23/Pmp24 family-domain-containing protein [Lipomyces tetrasporus]
MVWPFGGSKNDTESSAPAPVTSNEPLVVDRAPTTSDSSAAPSGSPELPTFLSSEAFDVSKLHPLAGLDKGLEALDLEDDALSDLPGSKGFLPSRGWSDDLCYGSGTMYMGGLALGGAYGFAEGLRQSPANAPAKLKLNSVLNAVTRRGPYLGNSAGILAISYNVFNGLFDAYRSYHDAYNSVGAGIITGILFRSTKGIKPMAISGALMGTAAGVWSYLTSAI